MSKEETTSISSVSKFRHGRIMLFVLVVEVFLLSQHSTVAFSFTSTLSVPAFQTRYHSLHRPYRSTLSTSLFARTYRQDFQNNRKSSKSLNPDELVQQIETSWGRSLNDLVRNNSNLFYSNKAIKALVQRIAALKHRMKSRDVTGLLNVLSKARVPPASRQIHFKIMSTLAELALEKIDDFEARDISMMLNALAKRNVRNHKVFEKAAEAAIPIIDTFKPMELANTVNAYSKMDHRQPSLFDEVATAAILSIDGFTSQGLANMVNAYAKMDHRHPDLFDEVAKAAIPIIDTFKAQEFANTVNAYAKLDFRHPDLFDVVAPAAILSIDDFTSQGLANMANAYAKMDHRHPDLFDEVAKAAIPIIDTFKAQALANTVNAYAKMNHRDPRLFDAVAKAAIPIIDTFKHQELAITVNAYAKMNHRYPKLFDEVAKAAIPIIDTFKAQALANTVNAYAKMNHRDPKLFDEMAKAAIPIIDTFKPQELAITVNAYAAMDHHCSDLFDEVAKAAIPIIDTFGSQGLANTASAFARNRVDSEASKTLFYEISDLIKEDPASLSNWEDIGLVQISYAFMKARSMDADLFEAIGREILSRDQLPLDAREWGNLAAAFRHVDMPSTQLVLELSFQKFQNFDANQVNLQAVADISGAIFAGENLQVVPSGFSDLMAKLAIAKSNEARPEDVRDILMNLSMTDDIGVELQSQLLRTYKPLFDNCSHKLNPKRRAEIVRIFQNFDTNGDDRATANKELSPTVPSNGSGVEKEQEGENVECLYSWLQRKTDGVNLLQAELEERGVDFEGDAGINALKRKLKAEAGDDKASFQPQSKEMIAFVMHEMQR